MAEWQAWELRVTNRAERDLERLDPAIAERMLDALERYALTGQGDITAMTGRRTPEWRLRAGDYRARFERDTRARAVLRVMHRREAYR